MVSHDFRLACDNVWKLFFHLARDLAVQLLPPALEQALIGHVPHQSVLEAIDRFRWLAMAEHEFSFLKLGESLFQCRLFAPGHLTNEGVGELAPDSGSDLADLFHRRHPVEACHQGVLECRRNGERQQRSTEFDSRRRP